MKSSLLITTILNASSVGPVEYRCGRFGGRRRRAVPVGSCSVGPVEAGLAVVKRRSSSSAVLAQLALHLLQISDRALELRLASLQPVHGQVVHRQGVGLQLAETVLDERFVELERDRCRGVGFVLFGEFPVLFGGADARNGGLYPLLDLAEPVRRGVAQFGDFLEEVAPEEKGEN